MRFRRPVFDCILCHLFMQKFCNCEIISVNRVKDRKPVPLCWLSVSLLYGDTIKISQYVKGRQWCVLRPPIMRWRFLHRPSDDTVDDSYRDRHVQQRRTTIFLVVYNHLTRHRHRLIWNLMIYWLYWEAETIRTVKINVLGRSTKHGPSL